MRRGMNRQFWRSLRKPWLLLAGRAKVVSESMRALWGLSVALQDVSESPRWIINATTYETGKNWRFIPRRMGDYGIGYVAHPKLLLAEAVAASAAFPGLIGPLALRTKDFEWARFDATGNLVPVAPPSVDKVTLWDGGVYDNLSVEALFKENSLAPAY